MNSFKVVILVALIVIEALTLSQGHTAPRTIKSYGQAPLLFGRRSNPSMSSLFFGKRSAPSTSSGPSLDDVRNACSVLIGYFDEVERIVDEEV